MSDRKTLGQTGPESAEVFSDKRKPATEYEKDQEAFRKNHELVKADRLAREAAKLKEQRAIT